MKDLVTSAMAAMALCSGTAFAAVYSPTGNIRGEYTGAVAVENPVEMTRKVAPSGPHRQAPEAGVEKLFSTDWMCLMNNYILDNTGIATRMTFAEDSNDVFIYDLFSTRRDYWVNAEEDAEGNLVIPMHQEVFSTSNGVPLTLEVSKFVFEEDYMSSEILWDSSSYTLQKREDGGYQSTDLALKWDEREYLVLCDSNGGVYYLIGSIVSTPVESTAVVPPTGVEPQTYSYSYYAGGFQQAELINVVLDGDDIYVKGLCPALPEVWLKGEFKDGGARVEFESGQFMDAEQYVHFFTAAHRNPEASEEDSSIPNWIKDDALVCDVNPEGVMEFRADRSLAVTIAGDVAYTIQPRILSLYTGEPAVPAKPIITEMVWMDVDFLAFVQPTLDVNGQYIDPANLFWRLYYDDQLFTFEPWEYMNIPDTMTEIPYGYDDNWDFSFYDDIGEQLVAIYNTGYTNIGIESVYRVNGVEKVSERAYYGTVTGVDEIENSLLTVEATTYYDLTGREVSSPADGVYIRKDRMSDGSIRVRKIRVR